MDLQKEIDKLKVKAGYGGKPKQWQYGFDLACRELAKAQAVQGWINVNLLSPQIDTEVLVCIDDDVKTAIYRDLDGEGYFEGIFGAKWWMPKPKAQEPAND